MHFANVFRISPKPRRSQYNTSFTWKSTRDLFGRSGTPILSHDICVIPLIFISSDNKTCTYIALKEYSTYEFNCVMYMSSIETELPVFQKTMKIRIFSKFLFICPKKKHHVILTRNWTLVNFVAFPSQSAYIFSLNIIE